MTTDVEPAPDWRRVAREVLARGRTVLIPAAGISMGPSFQAASDVQVRPCGGRPLLGSIIVFERGTQWIAHRVVWVFRKGSPVCCVTRGDGERAVDRPFVGHEEVVGQVTAVNSFGCAGSETTFWARWRGRLMALRAWPGLLAGWGRGTRRVP